MELNHSLAISGFVLSVAIMVIVVGLAISLGVKVQQLTKFKKQGNATFSDRHVGLTLFGLAIVLIVLSLACLILFITYEVNQSDGLLIAFELTFLGQMIIAITFLLLMQLGGNSLLIVVKNHTLIGINDIIDFQAINTLRVSKHHKFLYINYRDETLKGNVKRMKIRYSGQLKDFLTTMGLMKKENVND